MSQSRLELKVGLFVLFCLALAGVLLIQFSKGTSLFRPTYEVKLEAGNVIGLKRRAAVLLSGVQVGTVSDIKLAGGGTNVLIQLKIYSEFDVREDARFVIEQSGFLGDQFVAIYPEKNLGTSLRLRPGATMHVEEPFNLLEVARNAAGFIRRIDDTASRLNEAITDVRRNVLNAETLTNLAITIKTLEKASQNASAAVDSINGLLATNGVSASTAVSNVLAFSEQLNTLARSAQGLLHTNEPQINAAVSNLHASTAMLTNLLNEAQNGKGLAGAFLRNEELANNLSSLASNLNAYAAYMRNHSLWHVLVSKPDPADPKPSSAAGTAKKPPK